jgi:hypothetical protein
MNPHSYTHLIFDKDAKNKQWEKKQLLQQMLLGKVVNRLQETETRSMSITLYYINSKWIKDLNIRPQTLKLVQE